MPVHKSFLFVAAVGVAALVSTAAFAAPSKHATDAATPHRGGSVTIDRIEDSQSFDKTNVFQNESIWIPEQINETLYTTAKDGKTLVPYLATGYTMSKDGKTYTFTLRKGVKFSNGQPMTSADVKFSIDDARSQAKGWGYLDAAIKNITVSGPDKVVFHLKYQWAPFVADIGLFANGIIPNNFAGQTRTEFYTHPIGTGPFMWDKRVVGQSVTLKRNPFYWQAGKPYLDSVTWNVRLRRQHARAAAARRPGPGRRVPAVQLDHEAEDTSGVTMSLFPSTRTDYLDDERAVPAARRRARAAGDLVRDRPQGDRQGHALRLRHAGELVPAAAGAVLLEELAGPAVQHRQGEGRDGEVEVPEGLQGDAARRRRRDRSRRRPGRSSSRR